MNDKNRFDILSVSGNEHICRVVRTGVGQEDEKKEQASKVPKE